MIKTIFNQRKIRAQIRAGRARLVELAKADVQVLARKAAKLLHYQIRIRPRLRLISKMIAALALVFVASSAAVAYIKPHEAQIKINGQPVIVAQEAIEAGRDDDEAQISQEIFTKRSPFEFDKPVDGYLSQGYRSYHRAYDIATAYGAEIHPVGSGVVEYAGFTSDGKGNVVVVDHGDGLKSLYAHMGKIQVGVGNEVSSKTTIGTVGLTGRTTGAHVHLEIHDRGIAVNPDNLLP